jgi:hypothetical protein
MESHSQNVERFRWTSQIAAIMIASVLAGCAATKPKATSTFVPKSNTQLAIEQIQPEMLQYCSTALVERTNTVGNLLLDLNDVAHLLAICEKRERSLVDYIKPLVQQEQKQ